MVLILSVRCLNCNNVDEFPRMDFDQIPFCSQCAATSNLVPETPAGKTPGMMSTTDDELTALFSRNLTLAAPTHFSQPSSNTEPNFSISQHYTHPTAFQMDSSDDDYNDPVAAQLMREQQASSNSQTGDYAGYLLSTNPGSSTSLNELEIALAHGAISPEEYRNAIESYTHTQQLELAAEKHRQYSQHQHDAGPTSMDMMEDTDASAALEENCSAHDMLMKARRERERRDPVYRSAEWFNDYYGGIDSSFMNQDEEAPCSLYGAAGSRLRPFDL